MATRGQNVCGPHQCHDSVVSSGRHFIYYPNHTKYFNPTQHVPYHFESDVTGNYPCICQWCSPHTHMWHGESSVAQSTRHSQRVKSHLQTLFPPRDSPVSVGRAIDCYFGHMTALHYTVYESCKFWPQKLVIVCAFWCTDCTRSAHNHYSGLADHTVSCWFPLTTLKSDNCGLFLCHSSHPVFESVRRLLVTANVVPSPPILVTLMMEAIISTETSILTRATRHNIPEDDILHSRRRKNLKSYIALTSWTLVET
jgi:hypothetical protein